MEKLQILDNITAAVVDGDEHKAFENARGAIKIQIRFETTWI